MIARRIETAAEKGAWEPLEVFAHAEECLSEFIKRSFSKPLDRLGPFAGLSQKAGTRWPQAMSKAMR